jgi:hypothetical protein
MNRECYKHQDVRREIDCEACGIEVHRLKIHLYTHNYISEKDEFISISQNVLPSLVEALIPLIKEMYPDWEPPCS